MKIKGTADEILCELLRLCIKYGNKARVIDVIRKERENYVDMQ